MVDQPFSYAVPQSIPLPGLALGRVEGKFLVPPEAVALYAPALVGAIEFSTAWTEFFLCAARCTSNWGVARVCTFAPLRSDRGCVSPAPCTAGTRT